MVQLIIEQTPTRVFIERGHVYYSCLNKRNNKRLLVHCTCTPLTNNRSNSCSPSPTRIGPPSPDWIVNVSIKVLCELW